VSEEIIEKILEETLKKRLESLCQKGKSEHERQKAFKKVTRCCIEKFFYYLFYYVISRKIWNN